MKKLLPLLIFIFPLFFITGCFNCIDGTGHIGTENREIKKFTKLELDIPADVEIGISSKTVLRIHAQQNVSGAITTEVKGDKLVISSSRCLGDIEPVRINIFTEDIEEIEINSSGTVKTKHPITLDKIKLEVEGSGEIFADVYANVVTTEIEGSGNIVVNGTTSSQKIKIEGSGSYKAFGLRSYDAKVKIEGSGDAEISVSNFLNAIIEGSGSVIYSGTPKVTSKVSGSGSVTKMQ